MWRDRAQDPLHQLLAFVSGQPSLLRAVRSGDLSAVRIAVQRGKGIDAADKDTNQTAVHVAASLGLDAILGELLDRRANTFVIDKEGQTPLHAAAKAGHPRCCELLLGRRNRDEFKNQLLHRRDDRGWTALMCAANGGHAAAVVVLARAGADLHDTLEGRMTVGHLAAAAGKVEALEALAASGFDLAAETLHRDTLLHLAAQNGHVKAVGWLLQRLSPDAINVQASTALDLARQGQHAQVVALLLPLQQQQQQHAGALTPQ